MHWEAQVTLDQAFEWLAQNHGRIYFQKPNDYTTKVIVMAPIPGRMTSFMVVSEYGDLVPAEGIMERLVEHVDAIQNRMQDVSDGTDPEID